MEAQALLTHPAHTEHHAHRPLGERVRLFLNNSPLAGRGDIHVKVNGDLVMLNGRVPTWSDKRLATEFSRRVAGVIHILNMLEVTG